MKITYKKGYKKSFKKLDVSIKNKAIDRIALFAIDPFNILLNNHKLFGRYAGYRSINITGDVRAIFCEYPDGTYEFIEFIDIGTHSQLYK